MNTYKVYYTLTVEVEAKNKKEAVTQAHDLLTEELAGSHFETRGLCPTKIKKQTNDSKK